MIIAHLSDLHYGISEHHNKAVEKKIRDIADQKTDHLVITGDITNSGREREYKGIVRILHDSDFYSASRLSVVPGNHDLYMPFFEHFRTPESVYRKFAGIRKYVSVLVRYRLKNYRRDLEIFNRHFRPAFEGTITSKGSLGGYPYIKNLNENAMLIGIDSNELPGIARNPAFSNGVCDMQDYHALDRLLSEHDGDGKIRIAVMHNYLYSYEKVLQMTGKLFARFMATKQLSRYIELFEKYNINLVLHGHYHFNDEYYVGDKKIRVLNGGGTRWGKWHEILISDGRLAVKK
ncbi:MAG: metallophosphoesterase family protein [Ignavibacteriales bacterium]